MSFRGPLSYRGPLVKTVVFLLVSAFLGVMTWRLLSGRALPPLATYHAVFTDISALESGNDVRISGVTVGRVEGVRLDGDDHAVVTFGLDRSVPLTDQTRAAVRYKNLTGSRFLSLSQGIAPVNQAAPGSGTTPVAAPDCAGRPSTGEKGGGCDNPDGSPLEPGGTVPLARTSPALDLDALFGGFQPLFDALTPEQVNRLSGDLVQVLQGEGGTVMSLLRDVADFTTTLADRSALIGQVITNLNTVLGTLAEHTADFSDALDQAQALVSGLAEQKRQISAGLVATAELSDSLSTTLRQARPELVATSGQVQRLSALLTTPRNSKAITQRLTALPKAYRLMAGSGSYGAWTNFYLCGLGLDFTAAGGGDATLATVLVPDKRCSYTR